MPLMRTFVFVDGFNLYYGAVKGTPYKWLNLVELSRQLLPAGHIIEKVKYFTARVSGAIDPGAPARQQLYISALNTLPEIEVHFGRFLAKTVWRPLINLPVANNPIQTAPPVVLPAGNHVVTGMRQQTLPVGNYGPPQPQPRKKKRKIVPPLPDAVVSEVHTMEEKGSDVNLAVHLLNDAWKAVFDVAVVISNDTDLVTPIQMVSVSMNKPVYVVCPGKWQAAPQLRNVATHVRHIHKPMLLAAQLPDPIPGTTIRKPATW
jgi:hypothetical protein